MTKCCHLKVNLNQKSISHTNSHLRLLYFFISRTWPGWAVARIIAAQVCSCVSVLYLNHMTPSRITTTSKHAGLSYKCPARKHRKSQRSEYTTIPQNTHINTGWPSEHVITCMERLHLGSNKN